MEELLHKNIFNDRDLLKLSPGYCPTHITLRMQERRTMFKDSHTHSISRNNQWQRRALKRIKDGYKINKEMVKMQRSFSNVNLKNDLLMKNDVKHTPVQCDVETYNGELLINDLKMFNDDTDKCIMDIEEDMANLVLCNDREFKLNIKPIIEKPATEGKVLKNKNQEKYSEKKTEENHTEPFLRVECTYGYKSPVRNENLHAEDDLIHVKVADDLSKHSQVGIDAQVEDLQTLLIMMAISKSNKELDTTSENISEIVISPKTNIKANSANTVVLPHISEKGDVSNILNIIPLRIETNSKLAEVAKKYIKKWKEYVHKRKEYINEQRQATLNNFFDKLSRKKMANHPIEFSNKAKTIARDSNTYQHRYKVQKHIIALQKVKLEEQNRMIEELKYNKIIEASHQSVDAMKEEIRRTYYEIDRRLKPKIKCLTSELKLHEIEEPSLVLHCLKVPKFLQRMEKRAREREEKHAVIRERRRQMEEERIKLKQQAELAKAEMDKEEKLQRIKDLRDKRKREKIENIRKKQHVERLRALIVMADLHYEKSLMLKYGIRPLKLLVQIKRDSIEKAKILFNFQLKKNVFLNWMWYTEDMWYERNYIAENFYRKKILNKVFVCLKLNLIDYTARKQVAEDYYDLYVTQLVFRKFRDAVKNAKKESDAKWQKAVIYYNSNLLFKIFTCWRTLPDLNALKRQLEARKARWREKVLMVVPDYRPPDD